jgi:hypothetical protein
LALVALVRFRGKALSFDHGGRENEIERKGEVAREEREERAKMRVFIFIFNIYYISGMVRYTAN